MTDEAKKEEVKEETPQEEAQPEQPQSVMVQDVINNYPVDRERVRDTLLVSISTALNRIANVLEYYANQDAADRKASQIMADAKADTQAK